jgi:hypothetical protein
MIYCTATSIDKACNCKVWTTPVLELPSIEVYSQNLENPEKYSPGQTFFILKDK